MVRIAFPLDDVPASSRLVAETMWATKVARGRYEISNVPFYAYGISFGDVVSARTVRGMLTYREVLARSGHSTYRAMVPKGKQWTRGAPARYWTRLAALGCHRELASERYIAIDLEPQVDVHAVYEILDEGRAKNLWWFEEANFEHTVRTDV